MSWPTPQDYNEAVQNPNVNFRDPELRAARASLTPSGLPLPITGNFASVYRMSNGTQPLAVRCFFREFADMQARYAAISGHLQAAGPGYTTGFSYLNDGIAIRGKPFPVLKMDWVEGVLLDDYVRKHLADRKALGSLAEGWMRMAAALRAHGVAHGDLQHGNVLVRNGALCLVDYDGMFVPALAGKSSCELGHPNYQHPARDAALFGPHMDNFSHWLIYLSLFVLAEDPDLWVRLDAGDERLLFSRSDLSNPDASPAFRLLRSHGSPVVRDLADKLRRFIDLSPARVPYLDGSPTKPVARRRKWTPPSPERLDSSLQSPLPEWIAAQLPRTRTLEFGGPGAAPRVGLAGSATVLFLCSVPSTGGLLSLPLRLELDGAAVVAAGMVLLATYVREVAVRRRLSLLRNRALLAWLWRRRAWTSGRLDRRGAKIRRDLEARRAEILDDASQSSAHWQGRREVVNDRIRSGLAELKAASDSLRAAERDELAAALISHREAVLEAFLRRAGIRTANIRNIGLIAKSRLWAAGVRSAADVDAAPASVVKRLTAGQAAAVLRWHAARLEEGRRQLPKTLPGETQDWIGRKYAKRLERIERLRRQVLLDGAPILASISRSEAEAQALLKVRTKDLDALIEQDRQDLESSSAEVARRDATVLRDLQAVDEELAAYTRLTFSRFVALVVVGRRAGLKAS